VIKNLFQWKMTFLKTRDGTVQDFSGPDRPWLGLPTFCFAIPGHLNTMKTLIPGVKFCFQFNENNWLSASS